MRFILQAANELRYGGINDKRIPDVDVVADEEARTLAIKARRALHFEIDSRDPQDVAEKPALRPVVFTRVDEDPKQHQRRTNRKKVDDADRPDNDAADCVIESLHLQLIVVDSRFILHLTFVILHLTFVAVRKHLFNDKSKMINVFWARLPTTHTIT